MSLYYLKALTGESVYWCCVYGLPNHEDYHRCERCEDFDECDLPFKQAFILRSLLDKKNNPLDNDGETFD